MKSEKSLFSLTLEACSEAIVVLDSKKTTLTDSNSRFSTFFKISPNNINFKKVIEENFHESDLFLNEIQNNSKDDSEFTKELILKSGEHIQARVVFKNHEPDQSLVFIFFKYDQSSTSKKIESTVANDVLLETIISSIPYSVFWKDLNLNYMGCNERFAKDAGLKNPKEIIGRSDYDMPWGATDADSYREYDKKIIKNGVPILNIEETQLNADATNTYLLTSKVPLKDQNNKPIGILGIYTNITEFKNNQQKIQEQETLLVNAAQLSSLGEMASGIAHEINNPLSIISASTGYLKKLINKENIHNEPIKEAIQDIEVTIDRISKIIIGLRNISRETRIEKDICNFKEILDDVLSVAGERFKSHGIEVKTNFDQEALNLNINANRIQISQILVNLLNNSYDALSELNIPNSWIELALSLKKGNLIFSITDCGKGISKATRDKMFNPFFTTKEIGKGTGIGLSISRSMIEKHSGKLYYDEKSPFTKFVLELPIKS